MNMHLLYLHHRAASLEKLYVPDLKCLDYFYASVQSKDKKNQEFSEYLIHWSFTFLKIKTEVTQVLLIQWSEISMYIISKWYISHHKYS